MVRSIKRQIDIVMVDTVTTEECVVLRQTLGIVIGGPDEALLTRIAVAAGQRGPVATANVPLMVLFERHQDLVLDLLEADAGEEEDKESAERGSCVPPEQRVVGKRFSRGSERIESGVAVLQFHHFRIFASKHRRREILHRLNALCWCGVELQFEK